MFTCQFYVKSLGFLRTFAFSPQVGINKHEGNMEYRLVFLGEMHRRAINLFALEIACFP